ncbi:uncharacterized protein LOC127446948 isoform X3 [Myxocyprinus asiaticus]|uniref:uncharacterized protein LOC127446948 isoform X3 n=1 Tax=Myxocyprinus asiaticus TaxID=70543 RepID=UPI0022221A5C|nr:uncharacterized protein LOC127446948 isoform X3 [Myxocyprinus asiaticus]
MAKEMEKVYKLLENNKLEMFYNQFREFGIMDVQDFIDGVTDEDLENMNFTKVQKNRFQKMKDDIHRLGQGSSVTKSLEAYCLYYSFPQCQEHRQIIDMDQSQNTVEDLILRISIYENISSQMTVCLFTANGMPLTDDPFFNTWSLKDRHIENGSELYAIFTPKENLRGIPNDHRVNDMKNEGPDTVFCHVMLKGRYEVHVDLKHDTLIQLRGRLSVESRIPPHVLHLKNYEWNSNEILFNLGIDEDTVLHFSLSSLPDNAPDMNEFCQSDITPSVKQTDKGLSAFFSALNCIRIKNCGNGFKKVITYIRKISGCNALAQSLFQTICQNMTGTRVQKNESTEHENYASVSMKAQSTNQRFSEPVRVPGVPEVFDRAYVLEKIRDGEKIPNCSEMNLRETSLKKDIDVEKILLSLPPFMEYFPLWIGHGTTPGPSFNINPETTFAQMNEKVVKYPYLMVTPPLQLKAVGIEGPCLVLLSHEKLGMYIHKDKMTPQHIVVFDPLDGKNITVNVDELANTLRDAREDLTFRVSKPPKEAIVVLFDSSSSMGAECFDEDCKMKRIEAIKQIFDSFANRCMAYNLEHVICLVKFDSVVKTLHTFTETVETFKVHVHGLQAHGRTLLYDALNHGLEELNKVRERFPDCRCRIICLTDGEDFGSRLNPVHVATQLMTSNIVVDAVLLGKVQNNVLHGISNVTGGCCFKPETSKAALQLFEMETVLSLELRKKKKCFEISSVSKMEDLKNIFETYGYDVKPEVKLPPQIHKKVTMTENALKKKIMESKTGRFLEKDKRILEELKNLHCDPHPFFTVLPSETDFTFWKILMEGPSDTPYENGVFELYCEFGPEYPVKPPLVRFFTPVYHCNVNSEGRICHNIFDRNYSAHITMREILDAIFGLMIAPEPSDPLDSILAEEFQSDKHKYEDEAKKSTERYANSSVDELEKKYVGPELANMAIPPNLICPLTKKLFVDPVKTNKGWVYERHAIEQYLRRHGSKDPQTNILLRRTDLKLDRNMQKAVKEFRRSQIQETAV